MIAKNLNEIIPILPDRDEQAIAKTELYAYLEDQASLVAPDFFSLFGWGLREIDGENYAVEDLFKCFCM